MLKQYKNRKESGFTIIEVLIVLAIAGLIMIVVFLAVPALNRSQANQQQKTEANNLLDAYQEISNNNGGSALTPSVSTCTGGTCDAASLISTANVKNLGVGTGNTVSIVATTTTAQTPGASSAIIVLGKSCTAQNSNVPATAVSGRSIALFFQIQSAGSGTSYQCIGT